MIKRKIVYNKLTFSKKLEFNNYVRDLNTNVIKGGSHNEMYLGFDTEEEASRFMKVFYITMKSVKGIFAEFDDEGNLHLRYKTKLDKYL